MTYQQSGASMLRCVLIAEDGTETALTVPSLGSGAPARIRVPSSFLDAAAMDVYTLSHLRDDLPEAVYHYTATVPQSTEELTGPGPREQGPLLPD